IKYRYYLSSVLLQGQSGRAGSISRVPSTKRGRSIDDAGQIKKFVVPRHPCLLLLVHPPPHALPVLAIGAGDAAVALEELVGELEHRKHHAALGRPGDVPAAGRAPDELAGTNREASVGPFLVNEPALDHIGLLDLDVLVVG